MKDREIFRKNLNELMRLTKVKQIDIANYTGASYQTVSAWVNGRAYPRADVMEKLCMFFGVRLSALTEDQNAITEEDQLLSAFRCLSDTGKSKAMERMDELVRLYPKGRKS